MNTNELIKEIDNATVLVIREKLSKAEMTDKQAKEIATYVLNEVQPSMSLTEIYDRVSQFDDHFPVLRQVVIEIAEKYESIIRTDALEQSHNLLQKKDITATLDTLNKALKDEDVIGSTVTLTVSDHIDNTTLIPQPERVLNEIIKL